MKIGITLGDPKGIGPEIIFKALQNRSLQDQTEFVLYGDSVLFQDFSVLNKGPLIYLTHGPQGTSWTDEECGHASIRYLERAVQDAMSGKIDAMVTAPICKANLQKAGYPYPGHTEFLAEKTGTRKVVMMMAAPRLKVTLVTIHVALKEVPSLISPKKIYETVKITFQGLQDYWGLPHPKIAVCALNPHGGEQGILGKEEIEIIAPTLGQLKKEGTPVEGPLVPDAVFHQAYAGKFDAVVCMYHDQGLIPFKMIHFNDGVNVTLGLPIIRTSPDHGVAYDIVGKGVADPSSLRAAIELAIQMARVKNKGALISQGKHELN